MGRLLRSTTTSKLRKPVVVGASVTFRPVQVRLVAVRTAVEQQRHAPRSKLRKPAVVGASIVFAPIKRTLAPSARQARQTHPELRPPAATGPSIVFRSVSRTLAPQPRQPRTPGKSLLRGPTVVTAAGAQPLPPPLAVKLARALRPSGTMYGVGGPVVVSLIVPPFAPVEVRLAPSSRLARVPRSSLLGPPSVLPEPAPLDPFAPVDVRLARARRPPATRHVLRPPTVYGDVAVVAPFVLVPRADGSLSLAARSDGSLSLAARADGSLALVPRTDGSLVLTPRPDGILTLPPR